MRNVTPMNTLIDSHGRRIRKLRISVLDACNFRCFYCMPLNPKFMDSSRWLTPEEIENIGAVLIDFGLEQIRITGGEATMRDDFRDIVSRLSALSIKKLALTTNGYYLSRELDFLKDTKCRHLNISLDSLNEQTHNRINRRESYHRVIESVMAAKERGFHVKINTVLMRGVNDHEVLDFLKFSARHEIEVRFLELMSIGQAGGKDDKMFISANEVMATISKTENLIAEKVDCDSTSFNFKTSSGARIGFIASESRPFCADCSRWRLSADGYLRACLMSEKGVRIRGVEAKDYKAKLDELLTMKPYQRIERIEQDMFRIGG